MNSQDNHFIAEMDIRVHIPLLCILPMTIFKKTNTPEHGP